MAETPNYGLYVNEDPSELFLKWREKTGSNMTKIDKALSGKADKSRSVTATLLAASWSDTAPYMQSISIEGLTANQNGSIAIAPGVTPEQLQAATNAVLSVSAQTDGGLTISAGHAKPSVDIPVVVVILN